MSHLPALPVLVPLLTAALCFAAWKSIRAQRAVAVIGGRAGSVESVRAVRISLEDYFIQVVGEEEVVK